MMFTQVAAFMPALARASGFAFTAPLLGDPSTPHRVRLVFAVGVAVAVAGTGSTATDLRLAIAALPLELAAGALPGLVARWTLERVATGGQLIGLHLGLGFAQSYDPTASESATAARRIVMTIAAFAFLGAGGLEAGVRSVATPTSLADLTSGLPGVMAVGAEVLTRAMAFAAPVVIAAVVANAGLAVLNRAAPAFNAFAISLTVVLIGGGLVLVAAAPATGAAIVAAADDAVIAIGGGR